eukprot:GILK01008350.1.p1 GENE.GILK01008350.1~~GILK01008350.1.p1  ORF type:complete len:316 (+),score=35.41 GILK01008350.1:148-1095(+)
MNRDRSASPVVDKDGKPAPKWCHQCRSKKVGAKCCNQVNAVIAGQRPCKKTYCRSCLYRYYQESLDEVLTNPAWVCPFCRGVCSCSNCIKQQPRGLSQINHTEAPQLRDKAADELLSQAIETIGSLSQDFKSNHQTHPFFLAIDMSLNAAKSSLDAVGVLIHSTGNTGNTGAGAGAGAAAGAVSSLHAAGNGSLSMHHQDNNMSDGDLTHPSKRLRTPHIPFPSHASIPRAAGLAALGDSFLTQSLRPLPSGLLNLAIPPAPFSMHHEQLARQGLAADPFRNPYADGPMSIYKLINNDSSSEPPGRVHPNNPPRS